MVTKKCNRCRKDKPESEFSLFRGKPNLQCKSCRNIYKKHFDKNGDAIRKERHLYYLKHKSLFTKRHFKHRLKKEYNLSVGEYNAMIEHQGNKCLICDGVFTKDKKKKYPCIDHDHKTGEVRGILCRKCNLSLHYVEDKVFLNKALEYLNKQVN